MPMAGWAPCSCMHCHTHFYLPLSVVEVEDNEDILVTFEWITSTNLLSIIIVISMWLQSWLKSVSISANWSQPTWQNVTQLQSLILAETGYSWEWTRVLMWLKCWPVATEIKKVWQHHWSTFKVMNTATLTPLTVLSQSQCGVINWKENHQI